VPNKPTKAAAGARIGAELGKRKRDELLGRLGPHFARIEAFLQARAYLLAVMSSLLSRNGWSIAEFIGDKTPDKTQRLLNRASWDTFAAMGEVRKFAVEGLDGASKKRRRRRGRIRVGALDETGQEKKGESTAGVKRQHMGCADGVANGINTVHLSYVRERVGHARSGSGSGSRKSRRRTCGRS
jgi:SRSO17 transposase